MKHVYLKSVCLFLCLFLGTKAFAYDALINGIYYNFSGTEATVTNNGSTGCYSGDIVIPASVTNGGNTYNVTKIDGSAFSSCSTVSSVTIPSSVTEVEYGAFEGCTGKAYIHCPVNDAWWPGSWSSDPIGSFVFARFSEVVVGDEVTSIGSDAFWGCSELTKVTLGSRVKTLGQSAFYGCTKLASINIPNSVTTIEQDVFWDCYSLTSIHIPSSVTSIGWTNPKGVVSPGFLRCSNLASITVDANNPVYDSRNNCNAIIETATNTLMTGCKNTIIPESVTKIGWQAFDGCLGLTAISIPKNVTSILGMAFYGCSDLASITVDERNTYYDSRNNCNAIIETSSNTLLFGCYNTVIPDNVSTISNQAFGICTQLTAITIPNGVTTISPLAFQKCSALQSIEIGNNVTSIGSSAFSDCSSLSSITCLTENVPATDTYVFSGVPVGEATLYVPASALTAYKNADQWKDFGRIVAIGEEATPDPQIVPVTQIALNETTLSLLEGETRTLTLTLLPEDATNRSVTWKSSNETVATVNADGRVTAVSAGNATITVTTADGSNLSAQCAVTVQEPDPTVLIAGDCGSGVSYSLSADGKLTLSGSGTINFDSNNQPWKEYLNQIKIVNIPDGVTSICSYAFRDCRNATNVTLPSSLRTISDHAFMGCSGLTELVIPEGVESIGDYAFESLTNLEVAHLPSTIQSLGREIFKNSTGKLYAKCNIPDVSDWYYTASFYSSRFSEVVIEEGVVSIGQQAFNNCSSIQSLTLPSTLKTISEKAFENCSGLLELTLPATIESIGNKAFGGCGGVVYLNCNLQDTNEGVFRDSKITRLVVGDGVTSLGQRSFCGSSQLVSVAFPSSLTTIGISAFEGCKSLTEITLPTSLHSILNYAFKNCEGLTELAIPEGVETIGDYAFEGMTNLEVTHLPSTIQSLGREIFKNSTGKLYAKCNIPDVSDWYYTASFYSSRFSEVVIEEGVVSIGQQAFNNCSSIQSLTLPSTLKTISDNAFENCSGLLELTLPATIESIGNKAFGGCGGVVYLNCNLLDTNEGVFRDSKITRLMVADGVTSLGQRSFCGSSQLVSVTFSSSLTTIGSSAFEGCKSLTEITLPTSLRSILNYAFKNCEGLTELVIPEGVESIGDYAFEGQTNLEVTHLPSTIQSLGREIFKNSTGKLYAKCNIPDVSDWYYTASFYSSKFSEVVIEEGVVSIGKLAFNNCSSIQSLTLPSTLKTISDNAFENCSGLLDVYCYAENVPNAANNSFTASAVASTTLHVPASGMSAYRSTEPWSYFGSIVTLEGEVEPEAFAYVGGIRYGFASNYAMVVAGDTPYTGKVIIPASVNYNGKSYTVTGIGENAFRDCSGLTTIVIPEAVWNIHKNAFNNCTFQTMMIMSAAPPTLAEGSLQGATGTVYVPEQGLETYQSKWSEMASSFKPFEIATTNLPSNKWSRAEYKVLSMAFDSGEDYGSTSDDNPKHNVIVGTPSKDVNGKDWYALDYQCDWEMRKAPINNWCSHNGDIYVRRMFSFEGELPDELFLACGNDDAPCEYYLNGQLIWSKPNGWYENEMYQMSSAQIARLKPGEMNVLAYHVHQNWGGMYADSGLYPDLSKMNVSYQCGDDLTWSLDGETGTLTISGTGNMYNYGSRDNRTEAPWTLLLNTVKHIEIESGVSSIGNSAFEGCCSVNSVNIPESVTNIGSNAFRLCINLTNVYCYSATVPSANSNAFDGSSVETATLHVPEGSEDLYKESSPWNKFGNWGGLDDTGGGQEDVSLLYGTWRWNFSTNSYVLLTFSQEGTVRYKEYDKNTWETDEVYNYTYINNSLKITDSDGKEKGVIEVISLTSNTLQLNNWPDEGVSTFTKLDDNNLENVVLNGSIIGQWNMVSGLITRYENGVMVSEDNEFPEPPYDRIAFYENGTLEYLEYSSSNEGYHEDGNATYTIVDNKFVYGSGDWDSFIITSFDGSDNMEVLFQFTENKSSKVVKTIYRVTLQRVTDGGDPTIAGEFQGPNRVFGENLLKSSTCDDKTYTYHYDDNGFVTQIDRVRTDGTSKTYTISYDDDKIIVNEASGGRWVVTLGSNGYAKNLVEYNASGSAGDHAAFTYNADGQLTSVDYGDGDVFSLTYNDGNITRVTNGQTTTDFSYEASGQDKILNTGTVMEFDEVFNVDVDDYNILYYIGALGQPAQHLPLSRTEGGNTVTGTWAVDEAGRATQVTLDSHTLTWIWDDNSGQGGESEDVSLLYGTWRWNFSTNSYVLLTFSQVGTVRYKEYDKNTWQTDEVYNYTYINNSLRITDNDGKEKGVIEVISLTSNTLQLNNWPDEGVSTFTKQNDNNLENVVLNGSIIGQWNIVSGSYTRYENEVMVLQQTGAQTPPYQRFAFYDNGVVEFLEYHNSNGSYQEDGNGTYTIVDNKFVYGSGDWDSFIITAFDGSNNMDVYFHTTDVNGSTVVRKEYYANLQRVTDGGDDPTIAGEFQGAKRVFGENLLKSVSYDSETNSHYDGTYKFHYDSNGFVTQIDKVGSSGSSITYTITYGDKIIVNLSDGTSWTAELESHGYIGKLDYIDDKGNAESVTYSYNENGQLVSVDYGEGDIFNLTYSDGDITSVTNSGKTINYQYETASQSKILNTGGVMEFGKIFSVDMENLLYYIGAFGKPTKHLPLAGTISGMTITGIWTLDDNGRATKAVFNDGSISWNWDDNGGEQGGDVLDESAVLNGSIIGQWNIVSGTVTRYENGMQVSQQEGTPEPPYDRIAYYENGTLEFLEHNSDGDGYHVDSDGTYTIVDNKFVYSGGEWDNFIISSFDGNNSMEVVFQYRKGSSDKGYYVARAVLQRVTDGGDEPELPTDISMMDNVVYIEPVESHPGSELILSLKMKNNVGIQTVQFDLYLPDGVTVAKDDDGFDLIELSTERTTARKMDSFSSNQTSNGAYRVLINSNGGYTFDGTDGEIARVTVNIASDMAEGDYPLILKDIVLVNTNTEGFETEYVKSILTISDYMPGDINGDGRVNAIDLNGIVNYILERRTFPFTFIVKAADLNGDEKINAIDVNAVTNMILKGTTPKSVKAKMPIYVGVLEER